MVSSNPVGVVRLDHNSLGKGAFIVGLIALVIAFVPLVGFVAWLLGPIAVVLGAIALRRTPRGLAIAGIVTGLLALLICFWWLNAAKEMGKAFSSDTFNTSGEAVDLSAAPILDASIKTVWDDIEANKVAAGTKYGGHRLRFSNEEIVDFDGDAESPGMSFIGKSEEYINHLVGASFSKEDGPKIGALKKGAQTSFVCESIKESFGDGYSLSGCKLQ